MQPHLPAFSARDLAHTLWSLQRLRFLPDAGWMMEAQLALQVWRLRQGHREQRQGVAGQRHVSQEGA